MVVSLGRSRMLIMRNQIKSNQIIPYFQNELDDSDKMILLQKKFVVMMEDLKHYHHSLFILLTYFLKYNSQHIQNNDHLIVWIEEILHSITQIA